MIKRLFGKSGTSKADVVMAVAAGIIGVWKAVDTVKDYKNEQEEKENQQ
jgi:uncharacterized membrane protein YuzA (DUF378 family)